MAGSVNRPHAIARHGPPRTRSTHARGGFEPAPITGASDLYGGQLDQEQIGEGQISPEAIQSAHLNPLASIRNLINSPATVTIDDDGITIADGALTLEDEFSKTVATASGFAGGWNDFIRKGLLNGSFDANVGAADVTGRTASSPYWTLAKVTGASPWGTSVGQLKIDFATVGDQNTATADRVRISEGRALSVVVSDRVEKFGSTHDPVVRRTVKLLFYSDAEDVSPNSTVTLGSNDIAGVLSSTRGGVGTTGELYYFVPVIPGVENRYVEVQLLVEFLSASLGTPDYFVFDVGLVEGYDGQVMTTWTPALSNGGSATFGTRTGWYYRVGKMVFVNAYIQVTGAGSGGSIVKISLPVAPDRTVQQVIPASVGGIGTVGVGRILTSGSGAEIDQMLNSSNAGITGASLTGSTSFTVQGWYLAA